MPEFCNHILHRVCTSAGSRDDIRQGRGIRPAEIPVLQTFSDHVNISGSGMDDVPQAGRLIVLRITAVLPGSPVSHEVRDKAEISPADRILCIRHVLPRHFRRELEHIEIQGPARDILREYYRHRCDTASGLHPHVSPESGPDASPAPEPDMKRQRAHFISRCVPERENNIPVIWHFIIHPQVHSSCSGSRSTVNTFRGKDRQLRPAFPVDFK